MFDDKKQLPFWWMATVEVGLFVAVGWFLLNSRYMEAIAGMALIELREISWRMRENE